MTFKVRVQNNYGQDHFYVVDPVIAKAVSNLTGKKTVNQNDFKAFKELGINFELVAPSLDEVLS